jgi:hypothetical protein
MVDVVSYLIIILIGLTLMKISMVIGWSIIFWASIFFIWIQTIPYSESINNQVIVTNKSLAGQVDVSYQNLSLIPFFMSGIIHIVSLVDRSRKYEFSRLVAQGHLLRLARRVCIRGTSTQPPRKQIILSQHVPGIADVFSVMMFTGGNEVTVIQDLGSSIYAKAASTFLSPIYGGINIDRTRGDALKRSINSLADSMKTSSNGSYIIWPSGAMWKKSLKNGIVDFRMGAFYLSIYSQIPVCLVHVRGNTEELIVEKTEHIQPPFPEHIPRNRPYEDFINCPKVKELVAGFKTKIETMYRELDDKISKELKL